MTPHDSIIARAAPVPLAPTGAVPAALNWMPAGRHTIRAWRAGEPFEAEVVVDAQTAATMQAVLQAQTAEGHRPSLDFAHGHGAAAAWPQRYWWDPARGVMCDVEWSESGRRAVAGREFRAFSPEFYVEGGRVTGAPRVHGGLVNDPAFKAIAPLWASHSGQPALSTHQDTQMKPKNEDTPGGAAPSAPAAPAAVTTAPATPVTAAAADPTVAIVQDATGALQAKEAELAALRAQIAERDTALRAVRTERAKQAVQAAVARGALPAKDQAIQEKWQRLLEADERHADLLAALPSAPAVRAAAASAGGVHIVAEDKAAVLAAYAAEQDPRKRGRIYARELAALAAKGDLTSVCAATNTLGTLAGSLVTQRALELLKQRLPTLSAISTDFSENAVKFGQVVVSRIKTVPTVGTYSAANGYVSANTTTTDVPVTINQHKFSQVDFNAEELGGTDRDLIGEQAETMFYALGKDVTDFVLALITNAFTNASTITAANFARPSVIDIAGALNGRGVPDMGRFLLLNSTYFGSLAKDTTIANFAAYQRGEILTAGQLPPVHGFSVIEAPGLPTAGNLTGFAGTASTLVVATRLPNDYTRALPGANGGGVVRTVTEPNTGLSVQLVEWVNHQMGAAYARAAWMYGAARGQLAAGQRVISA